MRYFATILLLAVVSGSVCAQQSAEYRACNEQAKTQTAMNACASDEAARADAQLNDVYRILLQKTADVTAREKIRLAERAWIAYRDAYVDAMYPKEDKQADYGSIYPMEVALLSAKLTRIQIAALQDLSQQNGSAQQPASAREKELKAYLQHYVGDPKSYDNASTRYIAAFADLQDNGSEDAIVYFMEDGWCGSGGCTMLVLAPTASSYRLVTRTTITNTPIRILSTKSHGWHDIAVWVQGGGIQPGYEAKLSFNGNKYPSNPSVLPAKPIEGNVAGRLAISNGDMLHAKLLYP